MRRLLLLAGVMFASLSMASEDNRLMTISTAGDLYDKCTPAVEVLQGKAVGETERVIRSATCLSYINGFRDGNSTASTYFAMREKGTAITAQDVRDASVFCDNSKVTTGAIASGVVRYLEEYPGKREMIAAVFLTQFLKANMPCKS